MLQLHIFHRGSYPGHLQEEMFKICSQWAKIYDTPSLLEIQNFAAIPEKCTLNLYFNSNFPIIAIYGQTNSVLP